MTYDFNEMINRKNTDSIKFDFAVERGKPEDLLPLWVADMDFRAPIEVIEALESRSRHGIFGYTETKADYFETLREWFEKRFGWYIESSWLVKTPGVVFAISAAVRALTDEGDSVLIQRPVYYPFSSSITDNGRNLVNNPLRYSDGKYSIDLDDFERKVREENVKLFILCNPHNPVGRVWSREELIGMGDICLRYGVKVVADEIHADFVHQGYRHEIFADIKPAFRDIAITCTSPSKTFNLAGLQISNVFISNQDLRRAFIGEIRRTGYSQLNTLGLTACKAAYKYGGTWLDELKSYLKGNIEFAAGYIEEELPGVRLVRTEGTYLLWLDFNDLRLDHDKLEDIIVNKAKLWLDDGTMFGIEGEGFQRINAACPRATLEAALSRLKSALDANS